MNTYQILLPQVSDKSPKRNRDQFWIFPCPLWLFWMRKVKYIGCKVGRKTPKRHSVLINERDWRANRFWNLQYSVLFYYNANITWNHKHNVFYCGKSLSVLAQISIAKHPIALYRPLSAKERAWRVSFSV